MHIRRMAELLDLSEGVGAFAWSCVILWHFISILQFRNLSVYKISRVCVFARGNIDF